MKDGLRQALAAAQDYGAAVGRAVAERRRHEQRAHHGLAWVATSVAALEALLAQAGQGHALDERIATLAAAETLAQLCGGLPMAPGEIVRPADLGTQGAARQLAEACQHLLDADHAALRAAAADDLAAGLRPSLSTGNAEEDAVREQFRRFADAEIIPHAHRWHLANALIPDEIIAAMAAMGSFGVCIDPAYGGLGLSRRVMCIVTEEVSRGWIGAGSLGTRSEIAGELIGLAGTEAQKAHWLPGIASGAILPTAVFTEPDTGSDLAALTTRARRDADGWRVDGAKTWITHASRSDLMTMLVRTDPDAAGHGGHSLLLIPKTRGTEANPFPDPGLSGSEIGVPGYRGMREYALSFDGFRAPPDAVLGGIEGQGFRQLMQTFESARIQTAARAVGVAQRAFDVAFAYAQDRRQFGRAILGFPRVADKLVMGLADIAMARALTMAAATARDTGRRCDIEAGMAKLYAARTAWAMADAAVQIHGGNGFALEFEASRLLADARILSIFEGAAEIQAQVIARGLLERRQP